LREAMNNSF